LGGEKDKKPCVVLKKTEKDPKKKGGRKRVRWRQGRERKITASLQKKPPDTRRGKEEKGLTYGGKTGKGRSEKKKERGTYLSLGGKIKKRGKKKVRLDPKKAFLKKEKGKKLTKPGREKRRRKGKAGAYAGPPKRNPHPTPPKRRRHSRPFQVEEGK